MKNENNDKRYAVLIDADNISDKYIKFILDEISNDGIVTYKRIYGDWTKPTLASWKNVLLEHSITPIQQYGYTTGKNATDSAMIIDAMDILYSENVDGFCLVSSDSDFTRLASRLRESGMDVVGMGESKTPKPFISACNKFKYLDLLAMADQPAETVIRKHKDMNENEDKMTNSDTIKKAIITIVQENDDEDEWIFIGDIRNKLQKRYPDFDVRNFGFNKFTPFIQSLDLFEIKSERISGSNNKLIYVREK
ncbi:MAG: NYN domain-containing protein [Eubacteriales bacterium]|nr:NYN domain-containing protein [Eubacteriales bacterium]MDD3199997.1 NYN domain-containing protein [Eubacteriales bacterium]MDD4121267.1 NYN domain-containing protein [Eubacteriales bacterium]MDD4629980.1 NYN domain-containing protein [Eubacteriales bacterium]